MYYFSDTKTSLHPLTPSDREQIVKNKIYFLALMMIVPMSLTHAKAPRPGERHLTLDLIESEQSKDSHSYHYKISVSQHQVTYYGPEPSTCIRGRCAHKEWRFTLDRAQQDQLWQMIQSQGALTNLSERNETKGLGLFVTLKAHIKYGTRVFTSEIIGKMSTWGSAQGKLSDRAQRYLISIESIKSLIEQWIPKR